MSILVFHHWGPQVKILDVNHIIVCTCGADGVVEVDFYGGEVGSGGGKFTVICDLVTADRPSHPFCFCFVQTVSRNDANVGRFSGGGFLQMGDKTYGVGSGQHARANPLC